MSLIKAKLLQITPKVSHCLKSVSNGNTMEPRHSSSRNRARTWCFTLNNYTDEDTVSLSHNKWSDMEITKLVFQEEIGEEKMTKHLQGVVQFKNQISFTTLKEFHNKIRWSKCKNLQASIKYCSKQDTRNGELYTHGNVEKWLWKDKEKEKECISITDMYKDMKRQMVERLQEQFIINMKNIKGVDV